MKKLLSVVLFATGLGFGGSLMAQGTEAPATVRWAGILRQPAAWYGTGEARRIADTLLLYQTESGGWPKNLDMTLPPSAQTITEIGQTVATMDNDATITQLRFLGQVITAHDDPRYRTAFFKGFDYLLAAQYANGGWPQFFPLRVGYYTRITFNDNAMINVMEVLRDAAQGQTPFAFVDQMRRERAAAAIAKGVQCILRCQVVINGKKTVWCAQHDETTFAPAKARAYELPSLSGSESVGVVQFLMSIQNPSPEIMAAVQGAVAWFKAAEIKGLRTRTVTTPQGRDVVVVEDAGAPPLWGRFYDLETGKAFFCGRDGIKRGHLADIEQERRAGYRWYGDWAARLLASDYPSWEAKWAKSPKVATP